MSIFKTAAMINNLLKVKAGVIIDKNHNIKLIFPSCYISKQFYSANKIEKKHEELIKPGLTNLVGTELTQTKTSSDKNSDDDNREDSWKKMKLSLALVLCSFVGASTLIVMEFGKPKVGPNGYELFDEYSDLPNWLQYCYRTIREVDYYKRLIREPSREKLLPDVLQPPYHQPKYTLVLELIDVLVHPDWTYQTGWRFKKRPGIDQFLETLSGVYEIVIYTAEQGMTVFPIIEALDSKNLISYKLVRDATHFTDGHHVKNLDKLNRNLENVIVVDWNTESVKFHRENLFHITRWDGNDKDTTLLDLTDFLLTVAKSDVEDVRDVLNYYNEFENGLNVFREKQKKLMEQEEDNKKSKSNIIPNTHWSQRIAI